MPLTKNQLLAQISRTDLQDLWSGVRVVQLKQGQVLARPFDRVQQVYFPHGGILSCVVDLEDGSAIESGMIGCDGVFGASQAISNAASMHKVVVQVPAAATCVTADHLKAVSQSSPDLLALLLKYEQFFTAQVQQTSACNAQHMMEQRMSRWLLRMHDLVPFRPLRQAAFPVKGAADTPAITGRSAV